MKNHTANIKSLAGLGNIGKKRESVLKLIEMILFYDRQMPFFFLVLFGTLKEAGVSYYWSSRKCGWRETLYQIKRQKSSEIRIFEELAGVLLERLQKKKASGISNLSGSHIYIKYK